MKDITRIHLAKVPYNVELGAKKELEHYIASLESYTADADLLQDIEIRMTELLLERGVKQEDVIGLSDVEAIRAQLGEPKEFATDETASGEDEVIETGGRSLYRDLDGAVLGGVLAGIAKYLRVNVIWVRLIFIIAALSSFGIFLVVYVIACLVIPAAKTAAEKLQMAGKPVTLASIRTLNELNDARGTERAAAARRILSILAGIVAIVGVIGTIGILGTFGFGLAQKDTIEQYLPDFQVPILLGLASGVLLIALFLLAAFAAFSRKINKRIIATAVVIIVLGLSTFGTAVGSVLYQERLAYAETVRNTVDTRVALPEEFKDIDTLIVQSSDRININYEVTDGSTPTAKQTGLRGGPIAKITVAGNVATLKLDDSKRTSYGMTELLTVKGPKLASIKMDKGNMSFKAVSRQNLITETSHQTSLSLEDSEIGTLTATLNGASTLIADGAAISDVQIIMKGNSSLALGTVNSLKVQTPNACGVNAVTSLSVRGVTGGMFMLNDTATAIDSTSKRDCFVLEVNEYEGSY